MGVTQRVFGVTRKLLVEALGVTPSVINKWFTGETRPKLYLRQTKALLESTGKTLDELIVILDPYGE